MPELQFPNIVGNYQNALGFGRQLRAEDVARQNQSRLSELAAQAYGASPQDQRGFVQQAIGVDPTAGMALGESLAKQDDRQAQELVRAARFMKAAPAEQKQAAWQQVRGSLAQRFPQMQLPEAYDASVDETVNALDAAYGGGGQQSFDRYRNVGGALIDLSGDPTKPIYTAPEEPRLIMTDQGLVRVRPSGGDPEIVGGGAIPQVGPQRGPTTYAQTDDAGQPAGAIPPEELPYFQAAMDAAQRGEDFRIPVGSTLPQQPSRRFGPPISAAQQQSMELARDSNRLANEAAERARREAEVRAQFGTIPAGFRVNAAGTALEAVPGGPKPAGSAATEDERKAAGWVNQARFAIQNMEEALSADPEADKPGIIETYSPSEELANISRSDARQRYVQAASSFSEAVLRAATGAGVNQDEARQKVRELTPQRGEGPAVREQKRKALDVYLRSLEQRAGRALPATNSRSESGGRPPLPPGFSWED